MQTFHTRDYDKYEYGRVDVPENGFSKAFLKLRRDLDLPPVRLHDTRHFHATLLLEAGVHLKVVSERLGHSTIAITGDIYSYVFPISHAPHRRLVPREGIEPPLPCGKQILSLMNALHRDPPTSRASIID